MKSLFVLIAFIFSFQVSAVSELQLQADKAQILKAETKRLEKVLGKSSKLIGQKSLNRCPPDDIDIDINVDVDDDDDFEMDVNCVARWMDGSCRSYGADQPGNCQPNCIARWMDGTCRDWGPDVCR